MAYRTRGTSLRGGTVATLLAWALFSPLLLLQAPVVAHARSDQTLPPLGDTSRLSAPPTQAAPQQLLPPGVLPAGAQTPLPATVHPAHTIRNWSTKYQGRTFYVTELPRCEHVETVFSNEPAGETKDHAKQRLGGFAVCTGSFHHPRTMALADFLQKDGNIVSKATTGRWFFAVTEGGYFTISNNYGLLKGRRGVSAIALGQRLVPLYQDGFSNRFMNQVTERMALGLSEDHIYIVRGKSDIWRLAVFLRTKLPITAAINADGGHVVTGKAPVHIVFRWKPAPPEAQQATGALTSAPKAAPWGPDRQGWLADRPRRADPSSPPAPAPEAIMSSEIAERRGAPRATRRASLARAHRPGGA